jgi:hypothetical protein
MTEGRTVAGTQVSEAGCTRISNAVKVKEQMDAMVTRIEEAEREEGFLPSTDWTLSPQVSPMDLRRNGNISHCRPLHPSKAQLIRNSELQVT